MKNWQIDILHKAQDIQCEQNLLKVFSLFSKELGFDYFAYGIRSPLPLTNPKTLTINNYCDTWQEKYQTNNYLEIDPTVQHALNSNLPIMWTDELFCSALDLREEALSFGLKYGLASPFHESNGFVGMLTLSRSHEFISESELDKNRLKISWLTQVTHTEMSKLLVPKLMPESNVKLTNREMEVIRWTADGKTSGEISCIIKITERTVNFHINNVITKLNVCNKTSATIKAVILGLL